MRLLSLLIGGTWTKICLWSAGSGTQENRPCHELLLVTLVLALVAFGSGCKGVVSQAAPSGTSPDQPAGKFSFSPVGWDFGNVNVSSEAVQTVTVSNIGNASAQITQLNVTGSGYSVSGLTLPAVVAAGQSITFQVHFAPTAAGVSSGNVSVVSNASGSPNTLALMGAGVQSTLRLSSSSLNFGNVNLGDSTTQNVMLSNTGTASLRVTQANVTGAGYNVSGLALPLTIAPSQNSLLSVTFAPTAVGSVTGSVSIVSDAPGSPLTISLTGSGVQAVISVTPSTVSFGNVVVGTTNTQTVTLFNTGSATLIVSQVTAAGAGFSVSGFTLPLNISAGTPAALLLNFSPSGVGSVTGTLTIISNAPNSPTQIPLTGSGVAPTLRLSANPSSLSFGDVRIGQSALRSVTLTNTGDASVTISQVSVSGAGFAVSGISTPLTVSSGQTANLNVGFSPSSIGSVTGAVTVTSNAAGSPLSIALSGNGVQAVAHSVTLSWDASPSTTVVGYNVYRSLIPGGSYSLLTSSPVTGLTFVDSSVTSGQTYYYVATAVEGTGVESAYSNEAQAVIP